MSQEQACEISFILEHAWLFYDQYGKTYIYSIHDQDQYTNPKFYQAQHELLCLKNSREKLGSNKKRPTKFGLKMDFMWFL